MRAARLKRSRHLLQRLKINVRNSSAVIAQKAFLPGGNCWRLDLNPDFGGSKIEFSLSFLPGKAAVRLFGIERAVVDSRSAA
jgi:hypothetical protein